MRHSIMQFITKYFYGKGIGKALGLRDWYRKQVVETAKKVDRATVNGFEMFLDPTDSLCLSVGMQPEPETTNFLVENVKKGDVFVDVGAHIGYYTLLASKLVGEGGKAIAIEPHPGNFSLLKKNVKHNRVKNVELLNAAASNESGEQELHICLERSGNHSLLPSSERVERIQVKVVKIDDLVRQVDWLKIDVQGAEHMVLQGAQKILSQKIRGVIIENEVEKPAFEQVFEEMDYKFVKTLDTNELWCKWK